LTDLCARHGRTLCIIYYVRNVADHLRAVYMERLKRKKETRTLVQYAKKFRLPYLRRLNTVLEFIDNKDLMVRSFDHARKDIVADFLCALGVDPDQHKIDTHQPVVNRSLTPSEAEVLRRLNQRLVSAAEGIQISKFLIENRIVQPSPLPIDSAAFDQLQCRFQGVVQSLNDTFLSKTPIGMGVPVYASDGSEEDTLEDVLIDVARFGHRELQVARRQVEKERAELERRIAELGECEKRTRHLRQRLNAVEESTSWRVTAPLRGMKTLVNKLQRSFRDVRS